MSGAAIGSLIGLEQGPLVGLGWAAVACVTVWLGGAISVTAWGQWLICGRLLLPLKGELPWRTRAFLRDAHERGVLRQSGAFYQFRHILLQELFASTHSTAGNSDTVEGFPGSGDPDTVPGQTGTRGEDGLSPPFTGAAGVHDAARAGPGGRPLTPASEVTGFARPGHAFISYVREDSSEADALQCMLEAAGIPVWRDTASLWPGEDWRAKIRNAITHDALVFIACFSSRSAARQQSYQNEELLLAIDQLRRRRPDDPWLIPVRFDDFDVPDLELGAGRTLASIQRVDLFGPNRELAARRLVEAVQRLLQ
jgi:hypothetical protein